MKEETARAIELDKKYCWHPFTPQTLWCAPDHEPIMLVSGDGCWLTDSEGRRYFDGNSSIWCNIHGHTHPYLTAAIKAQYDKVAQTSYLGYGHPLAGVLAKRLCDFFPKDTFSRVFYSDDGSTAVESALRMSIQYTRQTGQQERQGFISFDNSYHGDTMGAGSLGGCRTFFGLLNGFGFQTTHVSDMAELRSLPDEVAKTTIAVVIEPVQGVNQVHPWPEGMLTELRAWADEKGVLLIFDEVMTGFGRTGKMFACMREDAYPDFLCVAKGLTGGYTPMAAVLTKEKIYEAFLGEPDELKTFFYGHTFTAHQVGCAAAMAGLDIFEQEQILEKMPAKVELIAREMQKLKEAHPHVYDCRQVGFIAGIELRNPDGTPFDKSKRIGFHVCDVALKYGLMTRPILDTIVFMPPLRATEEELIFALDALGKTINEVFEH